MDAPAYPGNAAAIDLELPSYARTPSTSWDVPPLNTQHSFHLTKKDGEHWLSLTVVSRAATNVETPMFFQGGLVGGTLMLNLEKEDIIDSVHIALTGQLNYFSHSASYFLNMKRTLWSCSVDQDPEVLADAPNTVKQSGKLKGRYEWPFSFKLPKGVSIVSHIDVDSARKNFRLPPSLSDGISGVRVEYQLAVRVERGRLRSHSKLVVPILFNPLLRPTTPSITRQLAYRENFPLVGADGDPEGWKTLPPVKLRGKIFKSIAVEAACTLSLARPLCYTRGTPIPLMLTIESADQQALDLLATRHAIVVRLVQRTSFGTTMPGFRETSAEEQPLKEVRSRSIGRAVWWPPENEVQLPNRRTLAGEIHIPEAVSPRCHILNFNLDHMVVIEPFQAVGFIPSEKKPLLRESVEIVTAFAEGPRPRAYMPPHYDGEDLEEPRPVGVRVGGFLVWV
ncbi:hypothetical protein SCP_1303980 [Sparassis crispa]|uniref:Arrestin-like N-terminal domain-containing protein n=1 Tax=Sparassis crispa TaxID=139825 RepID=A0A401H2C1_9APHY|nr:hypothetical protein SCP_1303980 [Sparassis crispa]GBE88581.1 hypothetical protein SCP_1303980 [Sparassis crispa]